MNRSFFFRIVALLITALMLTTALHAPADAAKKKRFKATIKRSMTMNLSTTIVDVGGKVRVSGRVTKSPKGTPIVIQRKIGNRWFKSAVTRTKNRKGRYVVVVAMPKTAGVYPIRALSRKKKRLKIVVSGSRGVRVVNKVKVTVGADPTTVVAGENTTITGTVTPFVEGSLVSVQKLLNGRWSSVTTTPVDSIGGFSTPVSVGPTTQIRAASPLVGLNGVGYSPSVTVTATPVIATEVLPGGTLNQPYSANLTAVGREKGTWTASPLPAGLSLNAGTGVISGTPTELGTSFMQVTYKRTSDGLTAPPRQSVKIVIDVPRPVITTTFLPSGTQLTPYSTTLTVQGNIAGTWTVDELPEGLSVNPSTGKITGAPREFGTFRVELDFTRSSTGQTASTVFLNLNIARAENPRITTSSLPDGMRTLAYPKTSNSGTGNGFTLVATGPPNGETATGTWSVSPALPTGLSLNTSTGAITGTPTVAVTRTHTFTFTQQFTSNSATRGLVLEIRELTKPDITTTGLTVGTVNSPYNGVTPAVTTVGTTDGEWSASNLPAGLSINAATGKIAGTPTASGTKSVTLTFTQDVSGPNNSDSVALDLVVSPVISTASLPDGTRTLAYSQQVAAVGTPAGTWTATGLPAGLSISAGGLITGAPTTVGNTTVTLKFTQTANGGAPQVTKNITLDIVEVDGPVITTNSLASGTVNDPYNSAAPAVTTTGPAAGTWSATGLPAGLGINSGTGVISGTPTSSGTFTVELKFTQTSSGLIDTQDIDLLINAVIATASLPDGTRTLAYSQQVAAVGTPAGTWTATGLPAGLSISAGGLIAGTPTTVGNTTVTLKFTQTANGGAPQVTKNIALDIVEVGGPEITTNSLASGTVNSAYTSAAPAVTTTGPAAGTWSATGLPAGLGINSGTGVISGTPTASGTSQVKLMFTQTSSGLSDTTANIPLVINAVIATASLPDGTRTLAYSQQVAAVGTPAGTWDAENLPAGLSISAGGLIAGTPTTVGNNTVTLKFTQTANGGAPQVTKNIALDIVEVGGPQITTTSFAAANQNEAYTSAAPAVTTTGPAAGTWSATGLPTGFSISATTGVISGTTALAGTFPIELKFTQTSSGLIDTQDIDLEVIAEPAP